MTIEQLKCPAVREWTKANRHIPKDKKVEEFNKWVSNNIDLINESVKNNINEINESFVLAAKEYQLLNESANEEDGDFVDFDWGVDDDDEDGGEQNVSSNIENEDSEKQKSNNSKFDEYNEETTLSGKTILTNSLKNPKTNIFSCVNSFVKDMEEDGTIEDENPHIWGNLDVSKVNNMTALFAFANVTNADLSSWDTGKVVLMEGMFYKSSFNNDSICDWNVGECTNFLRMFTLSDFNQTLKWDYKKISKPALDSFGKPIMLPNGKPKMIETTVTPPLIGANANEEDEFIHKFWSDELNKMKSKILEDDDVNETKKYNNMKHIVDFETFVNEGFGDFVKKGFNKIKSLFKNMTMKFDNFIAGFNDDGKLINATSPYTSLNYIADGAVDGVSAYTKVKNGYINENVPSKAELIKSPEYYGIIDKNSIEYENYLTMVEMINEHCNKYGDALNEEFGRVGFEGESAGLLDSTDITSKSLLFHLNDILQNTPADKGVNYSKPMLIWGAPGIGKSTIPNAVINAWNETHEKKKCLMVIECGNLTVDGFSLPMPTTKKIGQYMKEQPFAKAGVVADVGEIEKAIEDIEIQISDDIVKSWLPVYKETNDRILNKLGNAWANGGKIREMVKNEKTGEFDEIVTETTEGGLLLFDEFFRSNTQVFKILMQILLNRSFNGSFKLGNKWAILACSNRPGDDTEVKDAYTQTGAVIGTRFGRQFNFIPDFEEWKKWAVKYGHFDEGTISFLTLKKDAETNEYSNWHTIKPDEYENGKSGWPTPRTWSDLMVNLHNVIVNNNYKYIYEIPKDIIAEFASGAVGKKLGNEYADYIYEYYSTNLKVSEVFDNKDYKIDEFSMTAEEFCDRIKRYFLFTFDKTTPPTDEQLMNMFDKVETTITGHRNIIRTLYTFILEQLGIYEDTKTILKKYGNFIISIAKKYNLIIKEKNSEGKLIVNTEKTIQNIQKFCKGDIMDY